MYKKDLALNNQQWLACHKTKPNQTKQVLPLRPNIDLGVMVTSGLLQQKIHIFTFDFKKYIFNKYSPPKYYTFERTIQRLSSKWRRRDTRSSLKSLSPPVKLSTDRRETKLLIDNLSEKPSPKLSQPLSTIIGYLMPNIISTIIGYLMLNPFHTYVLNRICEHNLLITFLNEPELIFCLRLNSFKYF